MTGPSERSCLCRSNQNYAVCVEVGENDTPRPSMAFINTEEEGRRSRGVWRAGGGQLSQLRVSLAGRSLTNFFKAFQEVKPVCGSVSAMKI